jgi:hypothetical protein
VRIAGVVAAIGTALGLMATPAAAAKHDWTRFGFNAIRSNRSTAVAGVSASDLSRLKRQDVVTPGIVDSSPIYLHDIRVAGQRRDVFVASTSYGQAFALDADTGTIVWTYTSPSYASLAGSHQITVASPVADPKRGFVYIATPDGRVRKLSLANGSEVLTGHWPAVVTLSAGNEKLSAALNLFHGHVVATTANYGGPIPAYQGHVALVDRDTGELDQVFNSLCSRKHYLLSPETCKQTASGIWPRSGVVPLPGSGRLLTATSNGDFNGSNDWGDSVLVLSPDATRVLDNWTPANQAAMQHFDVDLGSTAPAVLRAGKHLYGLQGGKDGLIRLLDLADLNGHGHACNCVGHELQRMKGKGGGVFTTPAVWQHGGHSWAFVATYYATTAYRLSGKPPQLHRVWRKARAGSSPVIAGNLMYVFDPTDGGIAVYRPASGKRLAVLPTSTGHWNSPVVADGRIAQPVGIANEGSAAPGTLTIYRVP